MSSTRTTLPSRRPLPAVRRSTSALLAVGLATCLVVGCANDGSTIAREDDPPPTTAGGGWIGGPPDMGRDEYGGDSGGDADTAMRSAAGAGSAESMASSGGDAAGPASTTVSDPAGGGSVDQSPLRAGNIDDNAEFADFLAYIERVAEVGVPFRPLDPTGRVVVTVRDADGRTVAGAEVGVSEGGREVVRLRTTADGTVRFHPEAYGAGDGPFAFASGGVAVDATAGSTVDVVGTPAVDADRVPLDIAFAIDITGSMGDELERMKASIASVVDRIEALPGSPDVRLAMTAFRDEGDSFVTATHDFTSDVAAFRSALGDLEAGGGGDTPEALDEAVDEVLAKPSWRPAGEATQIVFVIGDAGGHPERSVGRPYTESMKDAAARGIKIVPIAASSTDDQAEVAFRQMAQFTGGRFVFLAYGAGGAAVGSSTDVDVTDYEELSLDDLIVRLVADELAARSGTEVVVPTTSPTTTRPAGQ